jgi:protein gp37
VSAQTSIEWTDRTWNPVRGCSVVSAGCKNCYAMKVAARFSGPGLAYEGLALPSPARWTGKVQLVEQDLEAPSHWRKPQRIFVNSMSDLFHEELAFEQIADVFRVMAYPECDRHTFQVLTKRPQRMLDFFAWAEKQPHVAPWPDGGVVLRNVWLGVSVEDQRAADERIPLLLQTPAALRFLSVEPLLGPVDLAPFLHPCYRALFGDLHWVIVGGESGPGARPCDASWVRGVVEQCSQAKVPVFVKQLGANVRDRNDAGFDGDEPSHWPPTHVLDVEHDLDGTRDGYQGAPVRVHLGDQKGGDPVEWPEDLRVRDFPETVA